MDIFLIAAGALISTVFAFMCASWAILHRSDTRKYGNANESDEFIIRQLVTAAWVFGLAVIGLLVWGGAASTWRNYQGLENVIVVEEDAK